MSIINGRNSKVSSMITASYPSNYSKNFIGSRLSSQSRNMNKSFENENRRFEKLYIDVQEKSCYDSFKKLYEGEYSQCLFFARKYVENAEIAEEVINDVFMRLWNKRKEIKIQGAFQSYLFTSIKNKCIDVIRKKNKYHFEDVESLTGLPSTHSDTLEMIKANELFFKIEKAIDLLPTDRKRIFVMSRNEGLMYREIAAKLNISIKTVETQMGRSLKFLRAQFKEELQEFYPS